MTARRTAADGLLLPDRLDAGLPLDWLASLRDYPRSTWLNHHNMGPITLFWLNKHRKLQCLLSKANWLLKASLDDRIDLFDQRLALDAALRTFFHEFELHHHVEENHYFPIYLASAPSLKRGIDLLRSDHDYLHEGLASVAAGAQSLFVVLAGGGDPRTSAGDLQSHVETFDRLMARHITDEEDVIVPLILARSEKVVQSFLDEA